MTIRPMTRDTARSLASFAAGDLERARAFRDRQRTEPALRGLCAEREGSLRGRAFRVLEQVYDAGLLPLCPGGSR